MINVLSFNKPVRIGDLTIEVPVDNHKYDKFAISINDNGLIELWSESCLDVGITYSKFCGFYVSADYKFYGWDSEIMIGRIDENDPTADDYRNCIWKFKRNGDGTIKSISKECFTSYSGRVK